MKEECKDNLKKIEEELKQAKRELHLFYELANILRATLELDELVYIILTAITSHTGLGFNRAMMFLVDYDEKCIKGIMGIGPDSGEAAKTIWQFIEQNKLDFRALAEEYRKSKQLKDTKLNFIVRNIKVPLDDKESFLVNAMQLQTVQLYKKDKLTFSKNDPILNKLGLNEFICAPIRSHHKIIGFIIADNVYSPRPISKQLITTLSMLCSYVGMIIEDAKLYQQAIMRSLTDSLTGLWNHGFFQTKLEELFIFGANTTFAIIIFDVDNFKQYNDANGHPKGDAALKTIARILRENLRNNDIACRYGGEEFSVILPDTDKATAIKVAERLRSAIEAGSELTISAGVAAMPADAKSKPELIEIADALLYQAKRLGKNRVCWVE